MRARHLSHKHKKRCQLQLKVGKRKSRLENNRGRAGTQVLSTKSLIPYSPKGRNATNFSFRSKQKLWGPKPQHQPDREGFAIKRFPVVDLVSSDQIVQISTYTIIRSLVINPSKSVFPIHSKRCHL